VYMVFIDGEIVQAPRLEIILGVFEGLHGRPMRASRAPGGYTYEVYPDFPGVGYSPKERAIANLSRQRPEEVPPLPAFPFKVCGEWGADE
jgi:hypothetical protein